MTAEPTLQIKTLGGLSIELDGRPITSFVSTKAEALLAYLALTQRQHPRETLADLLWDDRTQQQAMSNLRTVLYSLRKEVGPFVTITRKTAAINPESNLSVDALELETAVPLSGIQSEDQAQKAENALALYNGDFLAGFFLPEAAEFESWTAAQRENLHRTFVDASLQLGQWYVDQQEYSAAITTATRLLQIDPLAEAGHRQLMEALARNNQRAEALAQYEKCRQILDEELGLEPEAETQSLYQDIRSDTLPIEEEPATKEEPVFVTRKPTLPQQTATILGREKELDELQHLLTNGTQLVTIVGPGGIGKTTLALETAHLLTNHFDHGAAFVSLAPLTSAGSVVPAIGQALRIELQDRGGSSLRKQLIHYLQQKKLLIVLDNFEHLLDTAPLLTDIVQAASDVRLLATSRERLKLQVEQVYPLQGLVLTELKTIDQARQDPAVQLFLQHAQRVRPAFTLRQEHLQPLQEMFQLVGGLPLAIILAAGWAEVLSPAEIVSEIGRNLDLLEADIQDIPDRHQSMRIVFEGTWNRLSEKEQKIFSALSVFRGGFTLEAAREVAHASPRDLMKLVDRSLLVRAEDGRFQQHELLRQYAAEELARNPETEETFRQQHSAYYCRFLAEREADLKSFRAFEATDEIDLEHENIRTAWLWAGANREETLLVQAAPALAIYHWFRKRRVQQGADLFQQVWEMIAPADNFTHLTRAILLCWLGFLQYTARKSDFWQSKEEPVQQAFFHLKKAAGQGIDVREGLAFANGVLGWMQSGTNPDESLGNLKKSLTLYDELGSNWGKANAHVTIPFPLMTLGDYRGALMHYEKAQQYYEMAGDKLMSYFAKNQVALVQMINHNLKEAERNLLESINWLRQKNVQGALVLPQIRLAQVRIRSGKFQKGLSDLNEIDLISESSTNYFHLIYKIQAKLHLGHYNQVLEDFQRHIASLQEFGYSYLIGFASLLAGSASLVKKQIGSARQYLQDCVKIFEQINEKDELRWSNAGLAYVALNENNESTARRYLLAALQPVAGSYLHITVLRALPAAALFQAETGHAERAIELYALACTENFVANSRWFYDIAGSKIEEFAATLPPETVAAAQERGRSFDLFETADSLLQELTSENES